jgi:hypothetical protein
MSTSPLAELPRTIIPDQVMPCWVFTVAPRVCPDSIAEWTVTVTGRSVQGTYALCDPCKKRWQAYGHVSLAVQP